MKRPFLPEVNSIGSTAGLNHDFFRLVLDGHFYMWLPPEIGQPIIASATLVLLVMLVTGIILWWPKNRAAARQRFGVKWSARWRRKNYDLHSVPGFYMSWIGIIVAITRLVWGFQWFADSFYWVTNGGRTPISEVYPVSDTLRQPAPAINATDAVWMLARIDVKQDESLSIYFASGNTATIGVSVNHRPGTYYNTDASNYDQYTAKSLLATGTYSGKFSEAGLADKIKRMNYDIHVGAVLGIPGKILMFLASIVAASLPVTDFYIWWGRRKKKPAMGKPSTILQTAG